MRLSSARRSGSAEQASQAPGQTEDHRVAPSIGQQAPRKSARLAHTATFADDTTQAKTSTVAPRRRLQEAPQLPPGAAGHCFRGMNDAWDADGIGQGDGASPLDAAEAQPFALAETARQPDRTTSAAAPDALSASNRMHRWQENGAKRHPPIRDHLATASPLLRAKTQGKRPPPTQRNKNRRKREPFALLPHVRVRRR